MDPKPCRGCGKNGVAEIAAASAKISMEQNEFVKSNPKE
jgi:hypothetical protein